MSDNDALLAEATVQWYATGLMRGALSLPEQSRAADVIIALAARVRELEAALKAVDEACLAVCPDNNPAVVGADSVIEDSGRYVCVSEDGDPIIDADSPAEVILALDRVWGKTQERAETAEARVRELEADVAIYRERADRAEAECHKARRREQNLEGLLTYIRMETARVASQPVGEASDVVDTVRQLKQYADGRDAEIAALRAAKDEAERRMRNAEETNRVNESCLRNAMAEADALREERDEYRRQIMTASYDAASIGVTMIASDALAALREDRRRLRDALVEAHRELVELAEAKRYAGYGVIDRARAAIDAARKEET